MTAKREAQRELIQRVYAAEKFLEHCNGCFAKNFQNVFPCKDDAGPSKESHAVKKGGDLPAHRITFKIFEREIVSSFMKAARCF